MKQFLHLHYLPILLLIAALLATHVGGNDKAPFLMLGCGAVSMMLGLVYFATLRPFKGMISIAPSLGLSVLFLLAKLNLIDLMPILGFR